MSTKKRIKNERTASLSNSLNDAVKGVKAEAKFDVGDSSAPSPLRLSFSHRQGIRTEDVTAVRERSQTEYAMNRLTDSLDKLSSAVGDLRQRLEPVLPTYKDEKRSGDEVKDTACCALVGALDDRTSQVTQILDQVSDLISNLQI